MGCAVADSSSVERVRWASSVDAGGDRRRSSRPVHRRRPSRLRRPNSDTARRLWLTCYLRISPASTREPNPTPRAIYHSRPRSQVNSHFSSGSHLHPSSEHVRLQVVTDLNSLASSSCSYTQPLSSHCLPIMASSGAPEADDNGAAEKCLLLLKGPSDEHRCGGQLRPRCQCRGDAWMALAWLAGGASLRPPSLACRPSTASCPRMHSVQSHTCVSTARQCGATPQVCGAVARAEAADVW